MSREDIRATSELVTVTQFRMTLGNITGLSNDNQDSRVLM